MLHFLIHNGIKARFHRRSGPPALTDKSITKFTRNKAGKS